ncbi:hypothetical protein HK097_002138, partial [Rhizophlyctis rosea]
MIQPTRLHRRTLTTYIPFIIFLLSLLIIINHLHPGALRLPTHSIRFSSHTDKCDWSSLPVPLRVAIASSAAGKGCYKVVLHENKDSISEELWEGNMWEENVRLALKTAMKFVGMDNVRNEKKVFLDAGANIGVHSLFYASQNYSVHAFEPTHSSRIRLLCSLSINKFHKNMHVYPYVLSNSSDHKTICMRSQDPANLGATGVSYEGCDPKDLVETMTIDEWWVGVVGKRPV